jgi:hypothetical protein
MNILAPSIPESPTAGLWKHHLEAFKSVGEFQHHEMPPGSAYHARVFAGVPRTPDYVSLYLGDAQYETHIGEHLQAYGYGLTTYLYHALNWFPRGGQWPQRAVYMPYKAVADPQKLALVLALYAAGHRPTGLSSGV